MTRAGRVLVLLVLSTPALASHASYASSAELAPVSAVAATPCALLSPISEQPDQEPPTLAELLEDLPPAPRPMGFQAWPGCWKCYEGGPCCGCDQDMAFIPCDEYCGC
jgi:hypothetical protein